MEVLGVNCYGGGRSFYVLPAEISQHSSNYYAGDGFGLTGLALEKRETRIYSDDNSHKVPYVEEHTLNAGRSFFCKLIGKQSQRTTVLVECHPEKNHHSKYQAERHNASLCFCGREFFHRSSCRFFLSLLRSVSFYMLEHGAASKVDNHRDDERHTSHAESKVIGVSL